jgi:hypothetical protein
VVATGWVDVVHPHRRPVELVGQIRDGLRLEALVELRGEKQAATGERARYDSDHFGRRRSRRAEIEAGFGQSLAPGRRDEGDGQTIVRNVEGGQARCVVTVNQLDLRVQDCQVPAGETVDAVVELETDASIRVEMPLEPVQRVGRSCERIDDQNARGIARTPRDRRDVRSDEVGKLVAGALHRSAREHADASRVPVGRLEPVEADVVRVSEAVASVRPHLLQRQDLVSFDRGEEEDAVVDRGGSRVAHPHDLGR